MTEAPTAAAPSAPAASPTPAPSAANPLLTLADYDRYAAAALSANPEPAPVPEAPAAPAGPESPPASAPNAAPPGEATPAPPAEPAPPVADDEAEPTPEELAGLSESGLRALKAERTARKEARAEVKELKAQLEALEARVNTPTPPNGQPAPGQPAATPAAPAPPPSLGATALVDCQTFEAVDARAMQAARTEADVLRLQGTLARKGPEQAAAELKANGVEKINGVPVAEASDEQIADFLGQVYEGARLMQIQAAPRKQFLAQQGQAFEAAARILPELADFKSARSQKFVQLVQENPWLRQQGPHWPVLAAKYVLGDETAAKATAPAPKPAAPAPAPRPAPGAPRVSAGAQPTPSELDAIRTRLNNGTATRTDIDRYAALSVSAAA